MERKAKVLLAKLGLDVHNRGIITVAKWLRNAGIEIVYIGNSNTDEIVSSAVQEDADVVGVSSLGGAHLILGAELIRKAKLKDLMDRTVFVIGGVFSPTDAAKLRDAGFDCVFLPGAGQQEIVSSILEKVLAKRSR
jgi:methylmalonyl-CoA mutase C-terminal domain/subunit